MSCVDTSPPVIGGIVQKLVHRKWARNEVESSTLSAAWEEWQPRCQSEMKRSTCSCGQSYFRNTPHSIFRLNMANPL